jgi:hypothetical protein
VRVVGADVISWEWSWPKHLPMSVEVLVIDKEWCMLLVPVSRCDQILVVGVVSCLRFLMMMMIINVIICV